ncbi:Mss4-like protein [Hypoxylon sp. FL0890]|nr:Mss4-like protein [Hypoxylon sp. FL0890]
MATSDAKPLTVRCQCGNVSFPTPTAKPISLFHCHCTECQKQTGSAFGTSAIFTAEGLFPLAPDLAAKLRLYSRYSAEKGRSLDCYFCPECGSRMFHRIIDGDGTPRSTVSIKGGCIEGLDWSGAFHIFMRSAVMKIPAEWEQYEALPPWMNMDKAR